MLFVKELRVMRNSFFSPFALPRLLALNDAETDQQYCVLETVNR